MTNSKKTFRIRYSSGDDIQIIVAQPFAYLESGAAIAK